MSPDRAAGRFDTTTTIHAVAEAFSSHRVTEAYAAEVDEPTCARMAERR